MEARGVKRFSALFQLTLAKTARDSTHGVVSQRRTEKGGHPA